MLEVEGPGQVAVVPGTNLEVVVVSSNPVEVGFEMQGVEVVEVLVEVGAVML